MRSWRYALLMICLLPAFGWALEPGERLAPWTLLDQHDQAHSLDDSLEVLMVVRSMEAGKLVNEAMDGQPNDLFQQRHIALIADISGMPVLISKMFAVPAMRDYGYPILLDREARIAPRYPGDKNKVLWLMLDHGRYVGQRQYDSAEALRDALQAKSK